MKQDEMEFIAAAQHLIVDSALAGDRLRILARHGDLAPSLARSGVNEIEALHLIDLIDELERLIRGGISFSDTLEKLRREGWMNRIGHHITNRMGV